jgi:hypothetical protein
MTPVRGGSRIFVAATLALSRVQDALRKSLAGVKV